MSDLWTNLSSIIKLDDFKSRAFGRLSRAIQFKWAHLVTFLDADNLRLQLEQRLGTIWVTLVLIRGGMYTRISKSSLKRYSPRVWPSQPHTLLRLFWTKIQAFDAPPNESELVRPRLWVERILFPYETHSSRGSPRFVRSHPEVEYSRLSDVSPEDVVPVETRTIDEWTHPPFSGYVDGDVLRLAIGTFI